MRGSAGRHGTQGPTGAASQRGRLDRRAGPAARPPRRPGCRAQGVERHGPRVLGRLPDPAGEVGPGQNLRVFRAAGDRFRAANALEWLAVFDQFLGRFADARAELAEAARIFRAAGDLPNVVNTLVIGAATAMSAGDAATAARICGAIAAQRDSLGDVATFVDVLRIPDPERRAREALGGAAFDREFARGRALSLYEGIQLAVHDVPDPTGAS